MTLIDILDYWTNVSLESLWKENVKTCIENNIQTGKTNFSDDWELLDYTPFTEPIWGKVVNK